MEGNGYAEAGRAEADADEIVDVRGGGVVDGGGRDGGIDGVWTHGCVVVGEHGTLVRSLRRVTVAVLH